MVSRKNYVGTIIGLKLKNFKCHKETPEVELAPITLLVGPNSSGKSAFIEPLLILKQTMEPGASVINPIILNGNHVNLGSFSDIIYNHDLSRHFEICFKIDVPHRFLDLIIQRKIRKHPLDKGVEFTVTVDITYSKKEKRMKLFRLSIDSEIFKLNLDPNGATLIFSPNKEIFIHKTELPRERNLREILNVIPIVSRSYLHKEKREKAILSFRRFFFLRRVIELLVSSIENLQFIGPLRGYPLRYYVASGEKVINVGLSGEYAIQVLHQDYVLGGKLKKELERWLKELEVAEGAEIKAIDPSLFSLELLSPYTKTRVNIADIGFGVSQIIPVIVQSYMMPPGSTLILEQPEIHLHPRAQAILADLLIERAKAGVRFIVETHSEHLILRLQRRVAEKEIDKDKIRIYYFEMTKEGANIRLIRIDSTGQLLNFPKGFMEEGLEEAYKIAMASEFD